VLKLDLSQYQNKAYQPGSLWKRSLWYLISGCFFECGWNVSTRLKRLLLRWFGAQVGYGVVLKPRLKIKYPWLLNIGDYSWIGEGVWIDNLDQVTIGAHVCISQGALLLCGNHNYKNVSFDLMTAPITLEDGCWVGAMARVAPGVTLHDHAVLTLGSVATKDLDAYGIYTGVPAVKVKSRTITSKS